MTADGRLTGLTPAAMALLVEPDAESLPTGEGVASVESTRQTLINAGLIDDGGSLHPAIAPDIEHIRSAEVGVVLQTSGHHACHQHHLWGGDAAMVALIEHRTGDSRLVRDRPDCLASALAKLLRLGPRPSDVLSGSESTFIELGGQPFLGLLSTDPDEREHGARLVARATAAWGREWGEEILTAQTWQASRMTVAHRRRVKDGQAADVIGLVDTPAGIAFAREDDGLVELVPTNPTEVWTLLINLLT
jgi:hypothetical protein